MTKTIFLIGKTGSGKSTLANVISGTNKFKESGASISVTKEIQSEKFTENNVNYTVIDTVGIGDTKLTGDEVLDKIAEAVYLARDGVSQVLFVVDGRFDPIEVSIYNLLRTIIFDNDITDYTTITRTRFDDFRTKGKCNEDINSMIEKGGELARIIESCQGRIIHVNNPSLSVEDSNLAYKKNNRDKSRKKLLDHLAKTCQGDPYTPLHLKNLSKAITSFMEDRVNKRKELEEKKRILDLEIKEEQVVIGNQNTKIKVTSTKNKEPIIKEEKQVGSKQDLEIKTENIDEKIAKLESEIKDLKKAKKLQEEIQEIEERIREIIRNHILNNRSDIVNIQGGDIFISLIKGEKKHFSLFDQDPNELKEIEERRRVECQELGYDGQTLDQIENKIERKEKELNELREERLDSWKKISKEFTGELIEKWINKGFGYEEVRDWAAALIDFDLEHDADFCAWLRDIERLTVDRIKISSKFDVEQLRRQREDYVINHETSEVQKWLDENYPKETREDIINLSVVSRFLEGSLKLGDFVNLRKLELQGNEITQLEIVNCPNLEFVDCSFNQITTKLNLQNCPNLKVLYCSNNFLTGLDLTQNLKLGVLWASNNNFDRQDLSFLDHLTNLEVLRLGNTKPERIQLGIYNRFNGSLRFLKDMTRLKEISIPNTDIDSGLEYLPKNVKNFSCSANYRGNAKCRAIYNLFADEQGEVGVDGKWEYIRDFPKKLKSYKQGSRNLAVQEQGSQLVPFLGRSGEEIKYLQGETNLITQLIVQLETRQLSTPQKQIILNQVKEYLGVKRAFFAARQQTIEELQKCFNYFLEKKISKHAKVGKIGGIASSAGESVSGTITFDIPKSLGEVMKENSNFSKIKFLEKGSKELQVVLKNEESELSQLNQVYDSLIGNLNLSKDTEFFNTKYNKYKIHDILIEEGVWRGGDLGLEKMEKMIVLLSQNLEELKRGSKDEEDQFEELFLNNQQQPQILQPTNLPPKK